MEYNYKNLAKVQLEKTSSDFNYIIEDNGEIKRLKKETFEINFSGDSGKDSSVPATCDKTFTEVKEAVDNGLDILARHSSGLRLQLVFVSSVSVIFSNSYYDYINNEILYQTCEIAQGSRVNCRFVTQTIESK